jgi:hypothetical protein
MNRLSKEKSPYLLLHASNPVDWYSWGDEAFSKAREEKKPIFLSIGYSSCHWCHVMKRESFEDKETAKILNKNILSSRRSLWDTQFQNHTGKNARTLGKTER